MKGLLYFQTCLVLFIIIQNCIERKKIIFNHILCFSFGFLYYCVIPFFCFEYKVVFDDVVYNKLIEIYEDIPQDKLLYYSISVTLLYLSFIFGSNHKRMMRFKLLARFSWKENDNFNYSSLLLYPIVLIISIFILYINRTSIITGYSETIYGEYDSKRVLLSVFELVITAFVLYHLNSNPKYSLFHVFFNKWTSLLFVFSIFVLRSGGRMYVVTSFLSILIYLSYSKKGRMKIITLSVLGTLIVGLMGFIGTIRYEYQHFDISKVIFNVFAEPLFTNYSNLTYLQNYDPINLFQFPQILISGFFALIPTIIWPNKIEAIKYITDIYPLIEQPLGAMHYYPTFNGGLGIVFSALLMFILGTKLSRIELDELGNSTPTQKTVYSMVSSAMMFSIFRDPINTSLVKIILEFSIIFPMLLSLLNCGIVKLFESKSK